jgi:hypothetical protein
MPTLHSLNGRLDRLDVRANALSITASLGAARVHHEHRQAAWTAAGHVGRPPQGPLYTLDSNATRGERDLWRKLAHGRARVLHIGHETDGTSPFSSLAAAYAMTDEALLSAINRHPNAAVWPEGSDQ